MDPMTQGFVFVFGVVFFVLVALSLLMAGLWGYDQLRNLAHAFTHRPMARDLSGVHCDPVIPPQADLIPSGDIVQRLRERSGA